METENPNVNQEESNLNQVNSTKKQLLSKISSKHIVNKSNNSPVNKTPNLIKALINLWERFISMYVNTLHQLL